MSLRFRRGTLTAFVDRHIVAWELSMGILAVIYLAISFLIDDGDRIFPWLIALLSAVFVVEFLARFLDAPSRGTYLRRHWLDVVSSLPFIGGLRSFRLLRLLRLGAGLRVFAAAEHLAETRGHGRQSFWFVGPTLLFVWFAAAVAYWVAERGVNNQLHSFGDALYWAFITPTTLGYGSVTPVTGFGKALAGIVIFFGVGVVGFGSARLTQMWLRDESRHHPRLMLEKMDKLERDIAALHELVAAQQNGATPSQSNGETVSSSSSVPPTRAAPRGRAQAAARRRSQ